MAREQRPLLVLDGGMGHLLKARCAAVAGLPYEQQFLAGVLALKASPGDVAAAHAAYVAAGCDVITTNSFAATRHSLAKVGRAGDAAALAARAGALARAAADAPGRRVLVAGSLPPLRESYQCAGLPNDAALASEYAELADALAPHVDLFLAETLSTAAEAHAALQATAGRGKPVWVSFTLEDSARARLRGGEPLAEAAAGLAAQGHAAAVLVNCCAPGAAAAALPVLLRHAPPGALVGCYANGFRTTTSAWLRGGEADEAGAELLQPDPGEYDAEGAITPAAYLGHALAWRAAGACIIGGCCGVGPEHMALLAAAAREAAGGGGGAEAGGDAGGAGGGDGREG
ncbi:yitJ [Scenedesmus sp. PABB004]|nr:yitJ [Scenedesmus sp. PABB004]